VTDPGGVVVVDASALVAVLADAGPAGAWVAATIVGSSLAAPCLALFETANILRRQANASALDQTEATLAHADLVALPIELWPYAPVADRAWELRENVTAYDASYVALAEFLDAPVVTLDARLARSPGTRCRVLAHAARGT
jgi:predicted nucleic acid-binding protein